MSKNNSRRNLRTIPGVGRSIEKDLNDIGIHSIDDLQDKDPDKLFTQSNNFNGKIQDRCLLYVFREAVYFAKNKEHDPEKLKWWHWKD